MSMCMSLERPLGILGLLQSLMRLLRMLCLLRVGCMLRLGVVVQRVVGVRS